MQSGTKEGRSSRSRQPRQPPPDPIRPPRLRYWEDRAVKHTCAAYGLDHSHYRLPVRKSYDALGKVNSYWPPFPPAKNEALREGYAYTLFDKEGGWAITTDEAECLETSWLDSEFDSDGEEMYTDDDW